MLEIENRKYQATTIKLIKSAIKSGYKRMIVVLPTGAGKSIIMGIITKMCLEKKSKVLALMHRRQLVFQLKNRFQSCGVDSAMIMSEVEADLKNKVQLGTIQTYSRRLNFERTDWKGNVILDWKHPANLVMVDEAHRSLSKTYQDILKFYEDQIIIGFTATPTLSSNVAMGNYYEKLIQPVQVQELIELGSLVPGVYYGLTAPDLKGLKIVGGEYEQEKLANRSMDKRIIGDIVKNWNELVHGKRTLVFAVNVAHSQAIVHEFTKFGIPAKHLDAHSSDEEREEVIKRLKTGETLVVSNVGLYTEGTDIPELEVICLAKANKSIGRYLQEVGRGARPFPGKDHFIVLDHGTNVNRHGFYEDPIEWSLDGKKVSYKKPVPMEPKEKHKLQCENCNAIIIGDTCPQCGTQIEHYGKKIEALEADLKRLTAKKEKTTKSVEFRKLKPSVLVGMLKHEQERLNKKDSWVRAQYKNIRDCWPKSLDVRPLPATDELKSYLKYLRIKWVKSQKSKQG